MRLATLAAAITLAGALLFGAAAVLVPSPLLAAPVAVALLLAPGRLTDGRTDNQMTAASDASRLGYAPGEIVTSEPTRSAKYKWAIVVDAGVPGGRMVNAVACVAAATGALVDGLIAHGGPDASGFAHPGLPWADCTILGGDPGEVAAARVRAASSPVVLLVDMPPPRRPTGSTTTIWPNSSAPTR